MYLIDKNLSNNKKENLLVFIQILGGFFIPKINNKTIREISEKYQTCYTPANWIFIIWPILYCSLIYGFHKQKYEWDRTSENLFECVTISNLSWVYFWTKDNIIVSGLSYIPLCLSLYKLFMININKTDLILQNTLAAYLTWALIAATLNWASILKYKWKNKKYKKIISFMLCFSQIFWVIHRKTPNSFYSNSSTTSLVGSIAYLALKQKSVDVDKELNIYLLCCLINCYKQLKKNNINFI